METVTPDTRLHRDLTTIDRVDRGTIESELQLYMPEL